jgi:hypothetical protein
LRVRSLRAGSVVPALATPLQLVPGELAERVRDLVLALVAAVQVDERGPLAVVTHPVHQLTEAGPGIGAATGLYQGRVSYIINGKYQVTSLKSLAGIADGLHMPGSARATLGLAPGPADQTGSPHADKDGLASRPIPGVQYPATAEQAVSATAALWRADSARWQEAFSAELEPAAWNSAALAWLLQSARQHSASRRNRIGGRHGRGRTGARLNRAVCRTG